MKQLKLIKCRKCNFLNLPGTNYCQKCGSFLNKGMNFDFKNIINGGFGKGISISPLAMKNIEDNAKNNPDLQQTKKNIHAKVIPLPDGSCYCPDCGTYNESNPSCLYCKGCGRYF